MITMRLKLYALVAFAFVAALLRWRATAVNDAIEEIQVAEMARRHRAMREAKRVENEIEILDDTGLSTRASKWLRKSHDDE